MIATKGRSVLPADEHSISLAHREREGGAAAAIRFERLLAAERTTADISRGPATDRLATRCRSRPSPRHFPAIGEFREFKTSGDAFSARKPLYCNRLSKNFPLAFGRKIMSGRIFAD
jgi:hypothetical protein